MTTLSGITECWRDVPGYAGLYQVSDLGRVKSFHRGRGSMPGDGMLKLVLHQSGYLQVGLCKNGKMWNVKVHRLVLVAFVGLPPKGMQTRHLDGHKTNNRISNLRWGTRVENMADRVRHGTDNRGEKHYDAKLTEEDIREIRAMNGTQRFIAEFFDVSQAMIHFIRARKNWKHITR